MKSTKTKQNKKGVIVKFTDDSKMDTTAFTHFDVGIPEGGQDIFNMMEAVGDELLKFARSEEGQAIIAGEGTLTERMKKIFDAVKAKNKK